MAKRKPSKSHSKMGVQGGRIVTSRNILRSNSTSQVKTLKPIGRLERIKKAFETNFLLRRNSVKSELKKDNYGTYKNLVKSDSQICKERKLRKAEIMAKTAGRGLRVRFARWNADSYVVCR